MPSSASTAQVADKSSTIPKVPGIVFLDKALENISIVWYKESTFRTGGVQMIYFVGAPENTKDNRYIVDDMLERLTGQHWDDEREKVYPPKPEIPRAEEVIILTSDNPNQVSLARLIEQEITPYVVGVEILISTNLSAAQFSEHAAAAEDLLQGSLDRCDAVVVLVGASIAQQIYIKMSEEIDPPMLIHPGEIVKFNAKELVAH